MTTKAEMGRRSHKPRDTKGCWPHRELGEAGSTLPAPSGSPALTAHPRPRLRGERLHSCCFKPPGLWSLVTVAPGHSRRSLGPSASESSGNPAEPSGPLSPGRGVPAFLTRVSPSPASSAWNDKHFLLLPCPPHPPEGRVRKPRPPQVGTAQGTGRESEPGPLPASAQCSAEPGPA